MENSEALLAKLKEWGDAKNWGSGITNAIKERYSPHMENLLKEGAPLRDKWLSGMNDTFANLNTTSRGMSPAARLAYAQNKTGMLGNDYFVNQRLRDYFGTSINDMAGKGIDALKTGYEQALGNYNLAYGREQDALANARADEALRMQKQALNRPAYNPGTPQPYKPIGRIVDPHNVLKDTIKGGYVNRDFSYSDKLKNEIDYMNDWNAQNGNLIGQFGVNANHAFFKPVSNWLGSLFK